MKGCQRASTGTQSASRAGGGSSGSLFPGGGDQWSFLGVALVPISELKAELGVTGQQGSRLGGGGTGFHALTGTRT